MSHSSPPIDDRLRAVRAFVVLAGVLIAVTVAVVYLIVRRTGGGGPPPSLPIPTPVVAESAPKVNQYIYDDRIVLLVLVPGADPEIRFTHEPHSGRPVLTFSWSPPDVTADPGRLETREEFRLGPFSRSLTLPEGVAPPEKGVLRNGVLTVTLFRRRPAAQPIPVDKQS